MPYKDAPETPRGEVEATARDYFEGCFEGSPARMEAALHPTLVKRSLREDGLEVDRTQTAAEMIAMTTEGRGTRHTVEERRFEIETADIYGRIANVTVRSAIYREYLHLGFLDERWRILHALWVPVEGDRG